MAQSIHHVNAAKSGRLETDKVPLKLSDKSVMFAPAYF
jgi:hypothetical protein